MAKGRNPATGAGRRRASAAMTKKAKEEFAGWQHRFKAQQEVHQPFLDSLKSMYGEGASAYRKLLSERQGQYRNRLRAMAAAERSPMPAFPHGPADLPYFPPINPKAHYMFPAEIQEYYPPHNLFLQATPMTTNGGSWDYEQLGQGGRYGGGFHVAGAGSVHETLRVGAYTAVPSDVAGWPPVQRTYVTAEFNPEGTIESMATFGISSCELSAQLFVVERTGVSSSITTPGDRLVYATNTRVGSFSDQEDTGGLRTIDLAYDPTGLPDRVYIDFVFSLSTYLCTTWVTQSISMGSLRVAHYRY